MGRVRNISLLLFSHIFFAALCVFAAFWWFETQAKEIIHQGNNMLTHMAIISRYSLFVDMQRANDWPDGYRKALLQFSNALDLGSEMESPFYDEKTYHLDKMVTYERLSRLEKEVGNLKESEKYLNSALSNCSEAGWKNCNPDRLTEVSKKWEQGSLFSRPLKGEQ